MVDGSEPSSPALLEAFDDSTRRIHFAHLRDSILEPLEQGQRGPAVPSICSVIPRAWFPSQVLPPSSSVERRPQNGDVHHGYQQIIITSPPAPSTFLQVPAPPPRTSDEHRQNVGQPQHGRRHLPHSFQSPHSHAVQASPPAEPSPSHAGGILLATWQVEGIQPETTHRRSHFGEEKRAKVARVRKRGACAKHRRNKQECSETCPNQPADSPQSDNRSPASVRSPSAPRPLPRRLLPLRKEESGKAPALIATERRPRPEIQGAARFGDGPLDSTTSLHRFAIDLQKHETFPVLGATSPSSRVSQVFKLSQDAKAWQQRIEKPIQSPHGTPIITQDTKPQHEILDRTTYENRNGASEFRGEMVIAPSNPKRRRSPHTLNSTNQNGTRSPNTRPKKKHHQRPVGVIASQETRQPVSPHENDIDSGVKEWNDNHRRSPTFQPADTALFQISENDYMDFLEHEVLEQLFFFDHPQDVAPARVEDGPNELARKYKNPTSCPTKGPIMEGPFMGVPKASSDDNATVLLTESDYGYGVESSQVISQLVDQKLASLEQRDPCSPFTSQIPHWER